MKNRDLWQLAWRGLTRRPVRTILTALGITVAVASMVIFLSLGEGLRKVFTSELGGIGPDIQVSLNGFSQGIAPNPNLSENTAADIQNLAPSLGISLVAVPGADAAASKPAKGKKADKLAADEDGVIA